MIAPAPVGVELWRGGRVESRHRVHLVVAPPRGPLRLQRGDPGLRVYPRSAIKPFQALAMLALGADRAFGVTSEEIALACASHSGEPAHVERVAAWLARLGLDAAHLACGAHPPLATEAARALWRQGLEPTALHNNCSGKHAAMLTLARHLGAPLARYVEPDHPVQRCIFDVLQKLAAGAFELPPGIDGCSVPTWPLALEALARAAARFATGEGLEPALAAGARRIIDACRRHPELVAGEGRSCTRIIRALADGIVKTGAEGVYVAMLPRLRLGVALKVEDGAGRAAEIAIAAALDALGALDAAARRALADLLRRPIFNHAGRRVGELLSVPGWLSGDGRG